MAVAKITANKVDFKAQVDTRDKKSHLIMKQGQNSVGYNNPKCL